MSGAALQNLSDKGQAAWARRRPAWTRTDTVRWLNERSGLMVAFLRRVAPGKAPQHSRAVGQWLKEQQPGLFDRAHERLAACGKDEEARGRITVIGVLE